MKCQYCKMNCVKNGKQKDGTQKYRCKSCRKYQQEEYKYQACVLYKRKLVSRLIIKNAAFRGIADVLNISVNTVTKILHTEAEMRRPPAATLNGSYEVDEIQAYGKKEKSQIWACYGIERKTGCILGISTGKRNTSTLRKTINAILLTHPRKIYTDGYMIYKTLIPKKIHQPLPCLMSRIERLHLTARNALKMLNHKTLSFVRKPETLLACLKLLFWHN